MLKAKLFFLMRCCVHKNKNVVILKGVIELERSL